MALDSRGVNKQWDLSEMTMLFQEEIVRTKQSTTLSLNLQLRYLHFSWILLHTDNNTKIFLQHK